MAMLMGGAGGLSASAGGGGPSGANSDTRAATGSKQFNIGGNPNVSQLFGNPMLLAGVGVALLIGLWLWKRK